MKEYIERSAILDTLADPFRKASDETEVEILKCWDRIKKIPAADVVEVVKGKWESHGEGFKWVYICSVCGFVDGCPMNDRMNYCPKCGAKMDGGVNDATD